MSDSYKVFSGATWFAASSLISLAVGFALNVYVVRVLPQEQFGAFIILITVLSLLHVFSEMGVSVALVQRKELTSGLLDNALYLSLFLSLMFSCVLILSKDYLAVLLQASEISNYIFFLTFILVFRITSSVYRSMLLRDLQYKRIAMLEVGGLLIYATIVITLFQFDLGIEALLWGQVISAFFLLLAAGLFVRVFPTAKVCFKEWRRLISFGGWVSLNRVLAQAAGQVDRLIIASVVTPTALGGYYLAQQLSTGGSNVITGAVELATLPVYSRGQDDLVRLEQQYWRAVKVGMVVLFPLIVIPASHANVFFGFIYGERWLFAAELFQIISFSALIGATGGSLFGSILYAAGKTREVVLMGVFRILVLPLCIFVGSSYGVIGIAWALVVFGLLGRLFNQYVVSWALGFSFRKYFRAIWWPFLAIVIVGLIGWNRSTDLIGALSYIGLQTFSWIICVYFSMNEEWNFLRRQILAKFA